MLPERAIEESWPFRRAKRSILVAATLWCGLGCAEQRAPINRVQADALDKSFFVGADLQGIADDPEFYKRGTVVDVAYGAAQDGLFTSSYGEPVSRIRWEITEDTLNARLSYERITGTDNDGNQLNGVQQLKASEDGQIVASYSILSHFDIKNDYNPQTGENLNVVVENTTDRVWYERQYFRVDWSKNLISDAYDYDTMSLIGVLGGVTYQPFAYTVLDPSDPDAPHFDTTNGYFDITNKVYATPQQIDLATLGAGTGMIPACMLSSAYVTGGTAPAADCNPVELTIRESYRKVVDTDYEPENFDGVRFQAIGAFNFNYRRGYTADYGLVDQEWSRFISRYNIWTQSHYYSDPTNPDPTAKGAIACATQATTEAPTGDPNADPNRDLDGDGTADECEAAGAGSRCDVFNQKCTLPYAERQVRTIPWYIAGDTTLFDPTNWATVEWDLAMKTAVQTARLVECRKTGGGSGCDDTFPMWKGQQDDNDEAVRIARDVDACRRSNGWTAQACDDLATMEASALAAERGTGDSASTLAIGTIAAMPPVIVLCHNPVVAADHPACGAAGLAPRTGDLRYNLVVNIPNPELPSYWGIMTDADDPLTGEKVAASINIWTATTDLAAQQLVDLVRYANGELSTDQITNGTYIQNWVAAAKLGSSGLPTLPRDDIARRLAGATGMDINGFQALTSAAPGPQIQAVLNAGKAAALDVQTRNDIPSPAQVQLASTLASARGSDVEAQLVNPAMLELAGFPPTASLSGSTGAQISPLGLNNPLAARQLRLLRDNALAARGACLIDEAPEPSSLTGLADILAKKFPAAANETPAAQNSRYDQMFQYVRRRFHYSVLAHEMGHSIGLRHNFVSSSAPLFYRPQYWQLRTRNGQVKTACTDAVADGSTCVGPRYWDPVTDEEQSNLIWMWMQSSVMDYAGDTSQDLLGLGVTDFAAARFFYGDTVSEYTSPTYKAGSSIGTGITLATDTFGGLLGIRYGLKSTTATGADDFHYSQLQNNYQVITNCTATTPKAPSSWDATTDGAWDPVLDGHVVSVNGAFQKCRQQPVDYVGYAQLRAPTGAEENNGYYAGGPSVDPATSRLRVPYAFASDNWADIGNVSVFRHDNGADPYEQVQFLITTQEDRHILDNYRRNRSTFSLLDASQRSFDRYNSKLQGISSGVGFLASIYRDLSGSAGYSFSTLWPVVAQQQMHDNVIAATVAFDHFARELGRPEPGRHYKLAPAFKDSVLRSDSDPDDFGPDNMLGQTPVLIPNGSTGALRDVGFGGHPLENALSTSNGDFNLEYIENAGSYYDKINVPILLAESEDRFISQSRRDFYDARFRSVGMADILPDGFRRIIANGLTGDRSLLAPRLPSDATGSPLLDTTADTTMDPNANLYPASPLGWISFWPTGGPEVCFSSQGRDACTNYNGDGGFAPTAPANLVAIDPQVGWEVQKYLIMWTISYIRANQKTNWTDMLRIWRLGQNAQPDVTPRIEWQDPGSGEIYYAHTIGTECLYGDATNNCVGGQIVQKGIAARVLEYANQLTANGYELDVADFPATAGQPAGFNAFGRAMVAHQLDGTPVVKQDPATVNVTAAGGTAPIVGCNQNVTPACTPLTIDQNHWATELQSYKSVPDYLWQTEAVYGWINAAGTLGVF